MKNLLAFLITYALTLATGSGQYDPGDIANNVKVIEADFILPFDRGGALISKGQSTAIINRKGDAVVPYNTYQLIPSVSVSALVDWGRLKEGKKTDGTRDMSEVSNGIYMQTRQGSRNCVVVNALGKVILTSNCRLVTQ